MTASRIESNIAALYAEGTSSHELHRMFGITAATVLKIVRRLGGKVRSRSCSLILRREDLTGRKFGRWTVVEFDRGKWLCRCQCGVLRGVKAYSLRSGESVSCGCF